MWRTCERRLRRGRLGGGDGPLSPVVVLLRMLRALFALPVDEVVWASGWEGDADGVLTAALDLPRGLRHLSLGGEWKRGAIADDLLSQPVERFVWIDDAEADVDAVGWIERHTGARGLGILTRYARGIEPGQLREVTLFLGEG